VAWRYAKAMAECFNDGKSKNECERRISASVAAESAGGMHCTENAARAHSVAWPDPFIDAQEAPRESVAHGEQRHAG
jgi:hypothetical protein